MGAKLQLEGSATLRSPLIEAGRQMLKGIDTTRDSGSGFGLAFSPLYFLRSQFFGAVR